MDTNTFTRSVESRRTNIQLIFIPSVAKQHRSIVISRLCLEWPPLIVPRAQNCPVHVSPQYLLAFTLTVVAARLRSTDLPDDMDGRAAEPEPFLSGHPILPEDMGT